MRADAATAAAAAVARGRVCNGSKAKARAFSHTQAPICCIRTGRTGHGVVAVGQQARNQRRQLCECAAII